MHRMTDILGGTPHCILILSIIPNAISKTMSYPYMLLIQADYYILHIHYITYILILAWRGRCGASIKV